MNTGEAGAAVSGSERCEAERRLSSVALLASVSLSLSWTHQAGPVPVNTQPSSRQTTSHSEAESLLEVVTAVNFSPDN